MRFGGIIRKVSEIVETAPTRQGLRSPTTPIKVVRRLREIKYNRIRFSAVARTYSTIAYVKRSVDIKPFTQSKIPINPRR